MPPCGDREPDALHRLAELLAVLGHRDRARVGADQLDAVLLEHAALGELHRDVERRLPAHRRQQRVGLLALDDSSTNSGVTGSMYVRSANSGSVMIVAGFELTRMTSYPSSRSAFAACVPE